MQQTWICGITFSLQGAKPRRLRDVESHDTLLAKCFESRSQVGVTARVESHNMAVSEAEQAVKEVKEEIFTSVLDSTVNFVATAPSLSSSLIPAAVFLTGVRTKYSNIIPDST